MNNKGQTLVLFAILIPFLFILISFIVDIGLLSLEKAKISNNIKTCIEDVLKNDKSTEDLKILINKNIKDININNLEINNGILKLNVSKKYNGLVFKKNYEIKLSYKAYIENNKVIIKE